MECDNTAFIVLLNGMEVHHSYNSLPIKLNYPINDMITNENKLKVYMFGVNEQVGLFKDAKCSVTLFVREHNNFNDPIQNILTLSYDRKENKPMIMTTKNGKYSSLDSFNLSDDGDLHISKQGFEKTSKSLIRGTSGIVASINFSLSTPFPQWKFLSSEMILEKPFHSLTHDEYISLQTNNPKLKELYELNHKIYLLAKKGDSKALLSFFRERNEEESKALYKDISDIESELIEELSADMENSQKQLTNWSEKEWKNHELLFIVENNNKVAYIRQVLRWEYINGSGNSEYTMKFRYENGKWILTR